MRSEDITKLYHVARDTGLFVNLVPSNLGQNRHGRNWRRIFGKNKHNLPHMFYLGAIGDFYTLVCNSMYNRPHWIFFDHSEFSTVPELTALKFRIDSEDPWNYIEKPRLIFSDARVVTIDEVMDGAGPVLKEFIIFNLDLFTGYGELV